MSRLGSFLVGVKVLDLSRHLPGPLATLILADLGAEVLKIEPPSGDEMRAIGVTGSGPSPYYLAINAGKRTRTLDLKTEAGRQALESLVREADVLIESFRPGTMAGLGLAPAHLRELNPGLIYCALSGFGQEGPMRDRAAHDLNYLALTGLLDMSTPRDTEPSVGYPPLADCSASMMSVIAILGALHARVRDGRGCIIDLALADAALPQFTFDFADLARAEASPGASALLGGAAAYYGVYRVRDGHVTLAAIEPKFWRRFCAAAGRPAWLERQREALPQSALRSAVEAYFAELTLSQAIALFEPADCCFAPINDFREAIAAPHALTRGLLRKGEDGIVQALFPALVDGEPPALRAPLRGLGSEGGSSGEHGFSRPRTDNRS